MKIDVDELEEVCSWCEDSGILKFDFDENHTVGDECPVCNGSIKPDSITLEEFENQLRDLGYTEDEIKVELEAIESENEDSRY